MQLSVVLVKIAESSSEGYLKLLAILISIVAYEVNEWRDPTIPEIGKKLLNGRSKSQNL